MNRDFSSLSAVYRPWIEQLPGGLRLVAACDELCRAREFRALADATRQVFVDHLGFDEEIVPLAGRFETNSSIQDARQVARFGEFAVIVVHLDTHVVFTNVFAPVFSAFPYALVMGVSPHGRNLRVMYRRIQGSGETRFRAVRGAQFGRDPNDNVLTWARRFALLRPEFGDTGQTLRQKAHAAMELDPASLALGWQSAPISGPTPGPDWETLPSVELEMFFQPQMPNERRIHWGLQAAFENMFPLFAAKGEGRIDFDTYEVLKADENGDVDRQMEVVLNVTLSLDESSSVPAKIRATIPVPDERGVFTLAGVEFMHCPCLDESGLTFTEIRLRDEDLVADFTNALEAAEADDDAEDEAVEVDAVEPSRVPGYRGAGICGLLTYLTERKLGWLSKRLWHCRKDFLHEPRDMLGGLTFGMDGHGRLEVVSESVLRNLLRPVLSDWHAPLRRLQGDAKRPPSWACPDLSSALDVGSWYPVGTARLHPSGTLAVPIEVDGHLLLGTTTKSALDANPRSRGTAWGEGWIANPLTRLNHIAVGGINQAGAVARRTWWREIDAALMPGESLQAWVAPSVLSEAPSVTRRFKRRVPAGAKCRPMILVREGDRVVGDSPWLHIPADTYPGWRPDPVPNAISTAADITGIDVAGDGQLIRLPPGVEGVVVDLATVEVRGDLNVLLALEVSIEIRRRQSVESVILSDGRVVPVAGRLRPEDAPFSLSGETPDVVVSDPEMESTESYWTFAGETGEFEPNGEIQVLGLLLTATPEYIIPTVLHRSLVRGRPYCGDGTLGLEQAELEWQRLRHPQIGSIFSEIETHHFGHPPQWERIAEVVGTALDIELDSAPALLETPRSGRSAVDADYDPMRSNLKYVLSHVIVPEHFPNESAYDRFRLSHADALCSALTYAACDCNTLTGRFRLGERCDACDSQVENRTRGPQTAPLLRIKLPATFVHPWFYMEVAEALEISVDDLRDLLVSHGGPFLADTVRRAIERSQPADSAAKWLIDEVYILPPWLRPQGLPYDAQCLLESKLGGRYRSLNHAIEQYEKLGRHAPDWLQTDAWSGLQSRLEELFGDPDTAYPDVNSLAGTLDSMLANSGGHRHWFPGMFATGTAEPRLWVRWGNADHEVSTTKTDPVEPATRAYWSRRHSIDRVKSRYLRHLASAIGRFDNAASLDDWLFAFGHQVSEEHLPHLGRISLRELLALLEQGADATGLVSILESRVPTTLPVDSSQAFDAFRERLAFGVLGTQANFVEAALFHVFGNWWNTEDGWRWSATPPSNEQVRRAVPGIRSPAWSMWREMQFSARPVMWLRDGGEGHATLRALLGLYVPPPPPLQWEVKLKLSAIAPPETSRVVSGSVAEDVGTPTPVSEAHGDIQVLSSSLAAWFREQQESR